MIITGGKLGKIKREDLLVSFLRPSFRNGELLAWLWRKINRSKVRQIIQLTCLRILWLKKNKFVRARVIITYASEKRNTGSSRSHTFIHKLSSYQTFHKVFSLCVLRIYLCIIDCHYMPTLFHTILCFDAMAIFCPTWYLYTVEPFNECDHSIFFDFRIHIYIISVVHTISVCCIELYFSSSLSMLLAILDKYIRIVSRESALNIENDWLIRQMQVMDYEKIVTRFNERICKRGWS